jgi:hypothetical protein
MHLQSSQQLIVVACNNVVDLFNELADVNSSDKRLQVSWNRGPSEVSFSLSTSKPVQGTIPRLRK